MESLVTVRWQDSVASLALNRPEAHNALSPGLVAAIEDALQALSARPPRVLIISGEGPSFCAGADIKWMRDSAGLPEEEARADALRLARLLEAISEFPAPVVVRAHGTVAGGGNGLLAAGDIAVCADTTTFMFSEVRLGIAPAVIAPYVVRRIGLARATALWMTGERFNGAEAVRFGLVDHSAPGDELEAAVRRITDMLQLGGPAAQLEIRRLARLAAAGPGEEMAGRTADLNARLRRSAEGQEGLQAFLERRKPTWAQ